MKKLLIFISFSVLFADTFKFYTYSIKENYKEYVNNKVIDRDYNSFGDILGIGLKYTKLYNNKNLYFLVETAEGTSIYKGAYQNGQPLSGKQRGVEIFNTNLGINLYYFFCEVGYRYWQRGKSSAPGDYNEIYYWPYYSIGINYNFMIQKSKIDFLIKYKRAFNPKIKVYTGNEPILNLGKTDGFSTQLQYSYLFDEGKIGVFYRYSFWKINKSNEKNLIVDNNNYLIFEPESKTKNQYIGIFLEKSF